MRLKTILELIVLLFLTASIPLTLYLAQQTQELRSKASVPPSVLTIDLAKSTTLPRYWQNLAQGGEVPIPQLPSVVSELKELSPRYIRIDHVFDAYRVVGRDENGQLVFDFTLLDKEVDAIVKTGAIPFFSLSYVPDDLQDPENRQRPIYDQWERLVRETVAHYSGKKGKNLRGVFYEVYNEPDLFGTWDSSEYIRLYESSLAGAESAVDTWPFSIGGPAISYFNPTFIRSFLTALSERNLRLDFISWHVYTTDPWKITNDSKALTTLLQDFPSFVGAQKIISEWGPFPQKHLWYDSLFGASHLVATVVRSQDAAEMLFLFEAKDGFNDANQKFFGSWGILTSETMGVEKKPRFHALWLLSKLKARRFAVIGGDESVYALASGDSEIDISTLFTYYTFGKDGIPRSATLNFTNILPGIYHISKTTLGRKGLSQREDGDTFTVEKSTASVRVTIASDEVIALDIARISPAAHTTSGVTADPQDKAASISATTPLVYLVPSHPHPATTVLSFSLMPNVTLAHLPDGVLVQSSFPDGSIILSKETVGFASTLSLAVTTNDGQSQVSLPLSPSDPPRWRSVTVTVDNTRALLSLTLDDEVSRGALHQRIGLGDRLSIGGFTGAVDNVAVSTDGKLLFSDTF